MASYLMSLSSSRAAHKAALPSILCLFATASPTLAVSLTRSLSTERCACPQLVCDTDVFLRRDAYPAGKHLEAEKSPSKSRRQGLCCSQGLLTKWDSSLCLSLWRLRSRHWSTGPQDWVLYGGTGWGEENALDAQIWIFSLQDLF